MAFTSFNQIISDISSGKTFRADWYYRTNVAVATSTSISVAVDLSSHQGQYGSPNLFPGTSLSWVPCSDSAGNGTQIFGIPHGGNVSANTKHLMNATTYTPPVGLNSATSGTLILADLQGYWANINLNIATSQSLTGTPGSNLRYANGEGCRLYFVTTSATTGATAQNLTLNYTNQSANSRSLTGQPMTISTVRGQINSALPHTTNRPTFLPLVGGDSPDSGVANVSSITFSAAGGAGTAALCLARPLAYLPITTAVSYPTEREFVFQTPGMPVIKDGACLVWIYSGSLAVAGNILANTAFYGDLEFAWG